MSVQARPFHALNLENAQQSPLSELAYWSLITAYGLAAAEGIKLSTDHLDVLEWLRSDYDAHGKNYRKSLIQRLDAAFTNQGGVLYIYHLFPEGLLQALKIAGLPVQPGIATQRDSMH